MRSASGILQTRLWAYSLVELYLTKSNQFAKLWNSLIYFMPSPIARHFMFEDDEAAIPPREKTAISWEKLTGLSGNMLRDMKQAHVLAQKTIAPLSPIISDIMKSELNAVKTMNSSLAASLNLTLPSV